MNKSNLDRNLFKLTGKLSKKGYDWWWHNFTAYNEKTNEKKAFFIEYFFVNPGLNNDKVILGQDSETSIPSYFMIKCGTWGSNHCQLHNFYPVKDVIIDDDILNIKVQDNLLTETKIKGSCIVTKKQANNPSYMCDQGSMEWDLTVDKRIAYNVGYGASRFMRSLNAFEMFWHAEGIKTLYEGVITYNGERYIVDKDTSYGYADKNWGKDYTSPWLWISSCNLYSKKDRKKLENSAIEIGGGRPKIFGIPLNSKILVGIYYQGKMIEFNFSKFWKRSKTTFSFEETDKNAVWNVKATNRRFSIDLSLICPLEEMLEINYEAPSGKKNHNHLLNGGTGIGELIIKDHKGNIIDEIEFYNTGCEYGEFTK